MINVDVLYRIFSEKFYQKYSRKKPLIQKNEFKNDMMSLFDEFKNHVASQIIAHRIKNKIDRSIDDSTIISKILKDFNENWKDFEYREKIIPGKDFFAKMNNWLAERYQFTISKSILINSFEPEEINPEVKLVLSEFTELVHSN
jgi:ribosomal protein L16 Arg81 hydroxylase